MSTSIRKRLWSTLVLSLLLMPLMGQTAHAQWKTQTGTDLILGNNQPGQKFIFNSRSNHGGDFLQITFDNPRGQWAWSQGLTFHRSGNVGIGIAEPDHKLTVAGTIKARELNVTVEDWPDYVFSETYDRPTLAELEAYINRHKHLPGIPTARDVEAGGIAVGTMNARLLEKVEELTLYLLDLKHDQDALRAENEHLRARLAALEAERQ